MSYIGSHISSSKGYCAMGKQALKLGANTFAFFTRNPRGGTVKALDREDIAAYNQLAKANNFGPIVAHAPYTYNACAAKPDLRDFACRSMQEDLERLEYTPGNYYNFHPGSHVGQGAEKGIALISQLLNEVLWPQMQTTVLLETMAGKGSEVGGTFEELRAILDQVQLPEKVGICLDTCHVWDAGYDIVNSLDEVLFEFDRVIGLDKLKAIHSNDSQNPLGSHKDRHARIGEGKIGVEAFQRIVNHPALRELPFVLETPNDDAGWAAEIALLRGFARE
ncbi:deoxyribonuclease IV [uncultured Ruthenibacterium sp.]|uniref:deoxyribonuclease IV n=1 Tax=uncultured Ruthenibacterium sp. TaxID=1905347 RepID=UPI00349E79BD